MEREQTRFPLKKVLLLGRVLTRSGDQAWDFVVPLAILKLFPGELALASLYYFLIRLSNVLLLPKLSHLIDRLNRASVVKFGIFIQLAGVVIGVFSLLHISFHDFNLWQGSLEYYLSLGLFIWGGILGSLGSAFMDISIAGDLVPAALEKSDLAHFNSRLRQVDLATELAAPIIAGWLLTYELGQFKLLGFCIVAIWNVISFIPEYFLFSYIFKNYPELSSKDITNQNQSLSLFQGIIQGWKTFFSYKVSLVSLAYACLWLSVLSPHGVLLTGFLKDGWHLPEWGIGFFRGSGGFFGLMATLLFPILSKRVGTRFTTFYFLLFQLLCVSLALACFFSSHGVAQVGFLVAILFSRVGLYGFSLGEVQIRQVEIPENVRGLLNGFSSSLTAIATLGLYGSGAILSDTNDFQYLVILSVIMVAISFLCYIYWMKTCRQEN